MKKYMVALIVASALLGRLQAAQVDLGIQLGAILGSSGILSNARVELGTFTGYADSSGLVATSWFTGKDYSTLRGSYTSLLNIDSPQALVTDSNGLFYGSFDTVSTPVGTRLFAWVHSTSTVSSSANWAVITGGANLSGANASGYNPNWLAVSPSAGDLNVIEACTIYRQIVASSPRASLIPSSTYDPEGANISLIPEPSTGALLMIGSFGLLALRRLRNV